MVMSNIAYTGAVPTGVPPPVTDPLSQYRNPENPKYSLSPAQYQGAASTTQYPGMISTTQYAGTVPTTQYAGAVSTTQYAGANSTTQYQGTISSTGYTYYGGQFQPPLPEGYQWGYNSVTQEPAPPLPPSEDLPKPPPESQSY
jgi:hypothetical protein